VLITIPVRTLAEFIHRRGDLYGPPGGRVTSEEGLAIQRHAQRRRPETYQREVTVSAELAWQDLRIEVSGRVDGCDLEADPPLVEEVKATRADPEAAEQALGSAHWAQARLYAALLARDKPEADSWTVRLLYGHPDSLVVTPFERTERTVELARFLKDTIAAYGRWMQGQAEYQSRRNRRLGVLEFPYGGYRPHQRALAGRVFRAFEQDEHLLLEAPTGSGKTMGVLFPALKALSAGLVGRLFYLTSRGTGARAATAACEDLGSEENRIRVVDLIAKEKACLVAGMPCDDRCEYARGYYDRIQPAVTDLLARRHMTPDVVREVAQSHCVCPFELSLDAALWADLVIGDYNYLLDPVVRLQRFADDGELGLLIDESHQLGDRVRDMLSLCLPRSAVRAAIREAPAGTLSRRLKSVDRALMNLRRTLIEDQELIIDEPAALLRTIERAVDALADETLDLGAFPQVQALMFELARWRRSASWRNPEEYRFFGLSQTGPRGIKDLQVSLSCLDPAGYISTTLKGYGPHVRFSGTVSPLDLYQALHGVQEAPAERLESPFTPDQLGAFIVHDLPVYYRQREQTLPRLADLVVAVTGARPGNYLVALPSFQYLALLRTALEARLGDSECLLVQTPGMDDRARADFIGGFAHKDAPRLGLIVLGGVFAESVDFSHAPLSGVVCVGVGLPPGSPLREAVRDHFDARLGAGAGETVAYQQPAMTRVLQMAGRLLRGPADRGILCLVDDRFGQPAYQRFFPRHWQPERVRTADLPQRLENFWQEPEGLPRLRIPSESSVV
jgi:Rad3-related DNA helicase